MLKRVIFGIHYKSRPRSTIIVGPVHVSMIQEAFTPWRLLCHNYPVDYAALQICDASGDGHTHMQGKGQKLAKGIENRYECPGLPRGDK